MTRFSLALVLLVCLTAAYAAPRPDFLVGDRENIIIFGDSITADGRYAQIMQTLIDQRYPERRIRVLPRGSSGDTVHRSFNRVESDIVEWNPGWVLINLGINDVGRYSQEDYLRHYETLINRIYRDTDAKVGIVSPIYIDNDKENEKLRGFVEALPGLAQQCGCLYVPLYETMKRLRPALPAGIKYAPDGVHANPFGFWFFAETILQALNYPLDPKGLDLTFPSTRVTADTSNSAAGKTFTVALPMPLRVTIVPFTPNTAVARNAAKPIKLDGKLDDWTLDNPIALNKPEQVSGGTISWLRDHPQATAYACYDAQTWYFAIVVEDTVVRNATTATSVERDCIELMLDLRTPEEKAAAKSPLYLNGVRHICQYILPVATPDPANPKASLAELPHNQAFVGSGDKSMIDGVKCASTVTNSGYQLECAVPAACFPNGAITPGTIIGMDISINDVDRFDRWCDLTQMRWSGSQYSFFSTVEFGELTLE